MISLRYQLTLVVLALSLSACSFKRPPLTEHVVIEVNGHGMLAADFARDLANRLKDRDALAAKDPRSLSAFKARVTEDFLVQCLVNDWARENNVVISAEELDGEAQSVRSGYPDELAFRQALAEEGVTFAEWSERLRMSLLHKQVVKSVAPNASPSEPEVARYYEQNHARFQMRESAQVRQILVASEGDARSIEEQLKKGRKMADLAQKFSLSPEADRGGMVGWVEKDSSEIFEPAFRMKVGSQSPVVKSGVGFHIFEVLGRSSAHLRPLSEVRPQIRRILVENQEQSAYLSWLESRVRQARVYQDEAFVNALRVETRIE